MASDSAQETILWDLTGRIPQKLRIFENKKYQSRFLSPDGRFLADTGGPIERKGRGEPGSGSVRLWELRASREKSPLLLTEARNHFAFSADGKILAGPLANGQIGLWDLSKPKPLLLSTLPAMRRTLRGLCFSPDGKILLRWDFLDTVELYPLDNDGRQRIGLKREETLVRLKLAFRPAHLCWFPKGDAVLLAGGDGILHVLDIASRSERFVATGHTARGVAMDFTPDGRSLVSGSVDTTLRYWDLTGSRGREKVILRAHNDQVLGAAFSASGGYLLSAQPGKAYLWTLPLAAEPQAVSGHQMPIESLAWSPRGGLAVTTGSDPRPEPFSDDDFPIVPTVRIWELDGGQLRERNAIRFFYRTDATPSPPFHAESGTFSPDGKLVAFILGSEVQLWSLNGRHARRKSVISLDRQKLLCLAFSPDGQTLAIGTYGKDKRGIDKPISGLVRLWRLDMPTPRPTAVLSGHGHGFIHSLSFSPDGKLLASTGEDHKLIVWDLASGKNVREWQLPGDSWIVAFAPDSRHLATANGNGTIYIFRLAPIPSAKPTNK